MVLQLVKMGCDFDAKYNAKEMEFSDLENHRIRLRFTDKEGKRIYGDVHCWDTVSWQLGIKKCDKSWKPFKDIPRFAIAPDLEVYQIYNEQGRQCVGCFRYGDYKIDSREDMRKVKYPYTKRGLLDYVNSLSEDTYTDVEFVSFSELEKWSEWIDEQKEELKASLKEE